MHIIRKILKYIPVIIICLTVLYAGFILYFILRYGVDVPYMDQWEYVSFFDHLAKGTLTFNELFKLQGEYRQLFPNLIFVGLGSLTSWNVRYEMAVIFIMACLISYNVFRLASYTLSGAKWQKWLVFFLASLFIFGPFQYENWLFGVQIEYFLPLLCITSGMVLIYSNAGVRLKLFAGMILSTISTFSAANGIISWFLLFPLFYVSEPGRGFFRKWPVIYAWATGTLITLCLYFINYKSPVNHPSTTLLFSYPAEALKYFCGVLGNPFRIIHSLNTIIIVGAVLLSIYLLLLVYVAWHYKDKSLIRDTMVWIVLGLYSLGTTALITAGRLGFGLVQSLTPRYTTFSLYLIVSILFLAAIIIRHRAGKKPLKLMHKAAIAVFIALLLCNRADKYPDSVTDLKAFHAMIQHGKAGLLFINFITPEDYANRVYPFEFEKFKRRALTLDSLHLLRPGLIKSNIMQDIESLENHEFPYGSFDTLTKINDTAYIASGCARLPVTGGPADAVVLSYDNKNGQSVAFALYNNDSTNWKKTFSVTKIPSDTLVIHAWTFDASTGKAQKLKKSHIIHKTPLLPDNISR